MSNNDFGMLSSRQGRLISYFILWEKRSFGNNNNNNEKKRTSKCYFIAFLHYYKIYNGTAYTEQHILT